jgi:hypothetical protein
MWEGSKAALDTPLLPVEMDDGHFVNAKPKFRSFEWYLDEDGHLVRGRNRGRYFQTVPDYDLILDQFRIAGNRGDLRRREFDFVGVPKLSPNDTRFLKALKKIYSGTDASGLDTDLWPVTIRTSDYGRLDCLLVRIASSSGWGIVDYPLGGTTGPICMYSCVPLEAGSVPEDVQFYSGVREIWQMGRYPFGDDKHAPSMLLEKMEGAQRSAMEWAEGKVMSEESRLSLSWDENEIERFKMYHGFAPRDENRLIRLTEEAIQLREAIIPLQKPFDDDGIHQHPMRIFSRSVLLRDRQALEELKKSK